MVSSAEQDEAIKHFAEVTGCAYTEARTYLTTFQWETTRALQAWYEDEEDSTPGARSVPPPGEESSYAGPRTLDGRPAPYSSDNPPRQPLQRPNRTMTLDDLAAQDEVEHEDGDGGLGPRDLFAGGEKSGLAVQDPAQDSRDLLRDIMAKARADARRPDPAAGPSRPSHFHGAGQTLGGEGVPSRMIPGTGGPTPPSAGPRQAGGGSGEQVSERVLHLWTNGFSIDDGPLHRLDDPRNTETLRMIRQGRVPFHLMNISYDEAVDVKLENHHEEWRQLPRVYRPFGGGGRRLGSPVPGDRAAATPSLTSTAASSSVTQQSASPSTGADESQPTITIRIQLPDGTRLPARFNTSQTVGDVYEFVQASNPATRSRNWVLQTTFPNKEHIDRGTVLGEMAEFKRGGTAVVKWV